MFVSFWILTAIGIARRSSGSALSGCGVVVVISAVAGVVVAIVGVTVAVTVAATRWDPNIDFTRLAADELKGASSLHVACRGCFHMTRCAVVASHAGMGRVVSKAVGPTVDESCVSHLVDELGAWWSWW